MSVNLQYTLINENEENGCITLNTKGDDVEVILLNDERFKGTIKYISSREMCLIVKQKMFIGEIKIPIKNIKICDYTELDF